MAKARSRVAARKTKDKWKAKAWYEVQAPPHFGKATIAETLADEPDKLIGRVAVTTLQELTGDFKQMHVKLAFRIDQVDGKTAKTHFSGHTLTSDYIRRMTRRNHSKIDAVVEVLTKDGGQVRVKPFAVSDKRTQTTQEKALRAIMHDEIIAHGSEVTLNRFIRDVIDGKVASRVYKACKPIYPVRRVEINKTEVRRLPQVDLEEDWEAEFAEPEPEPTPEPETETETEATEEDTGSAEEPAEEAPAEEAEATEEEVPATAEAESAEEPAEEVSAEAKE